MWSFCLLPPTAEAVWGSEGHFLGMPFVTFSMYSRAGLASQTLCVQHCLAASQPGTRSLGPPGAGWAVLGQAFQPFIFDLCLGSFLVALFCRLRFAHAINRICP